MNDDSICYSIMLQRNGFAPSW